MNSNNNQNHQLTHQALSHQQQLIQHMQQMHHHQQQQQQQQHGGYLANGGGGMMSGTGAGGSGNMGNNNIMLSDLPEPPIPVSEIGPIPPPPMFSTPSPTMVAGRPHGPAVMMGHRELNDYDYDGEFDDAIACLMCLMRVCVSLIDDQDELDSDEEFYMQNPNIDTSRVDEIPAKEPKFNAVPLKSALKKKSSNPGTPTQDGNRTLLERQGNSSFK